MRLRTMLVALLAIVAAGCVGTPPPDPMTPPVADLDDPSGPTPETPSDEPPASAPPPEAPPEENVTPEAEPEPEPVPEIPLFARYVFNGTTPVVEMWSSVWGPEHPFEVRPDTLHIRATLEWEGAGDLDPAIMAPVSYAGGFPWWLRGAAEYQLAPVAGAEWLFVNDSGTPATPDPGATVEVLEVDIRSLDERCAAAFEEKGYCLWHAAPFVKGASDVPYVLTVEVTRAGG